MIWKDLYIEEDSRERAQYLWVSIFYFMAKTLIDDFGLEGERVIRKAVRDFGLERAIRKRQRTDAAGLTPDLVAMNSIHATDLYSEPRFEKPCGKEFFNLIEPEHSWTKYYTCPNNDMWAALEGKKPGDHLSTGVIYCEEVHHYLYAKYDPAIQMNLCDILTKGDECCNFRIHLRKANQMPFDAGEYKAQRWEDFGTDVTASIVSMFSLHFYHYAKAVYDTFGEAELRKIIRLWANERGNRLRELNRRKGQENNVDILVEQGDLFLDPRIGKENITLSADEGKVTVKRCITCELLQDHGADYLAKIFCEEACKGVCETYNSEIKVELEETLACGCDHCSIRLIK